MIQLLLTFLEDSFMIHFLAKYIGIAKKHLFIPIVTIICIIETCIANGDLASKLLPIVLSLSLVLCVFIVKKNIVLNDVIACLIFPSIIIATDLMSLVIMSVLLNVDFSSIVNNHHYVILASFIAKLLLFLCYASFLHIRFNHKKRLDYKRWWVLLPIWCITFSLLYFLGLSILNGDFNLNIIYFITAFLIILTIFLLFLVYRILQENERMIKIELDNQKLYYIKKNKEVIDRLHGEISKIQHSNTYYFLYMKALLDTKNYLSLGFFIDENINKIKKYKNATNSKNPIFNYYINKEINSLLLKNPNIKISTYIKNEDFNVEETQLISVVKVIDYLFTISSKNEGFNLQFSQIDVFIKISIIFTKNSTSISYKEIGNNLKQSEDLNYSLKMVNNYYVCTILIDTWRDDEINS